MPPERIPAEVRDARREVARLVTERDSFLRDAARAGSIDVLRLDDLDRAIAGVLDDIAPLVDPCDASEAHPLVLLPVRLETRFGTSGNRTTLRVRIYPDEIHVDDLARGLTDEEAEAGRAYWTSAWSDPVPEGAWERLVAAAGPDRAEWVAHVCTPSNLAERGTAPAPAFAKVEPRGPRNVVARALPDRFVVVAIQGDHVSSGTGNPIPRDLSLTPIPLAGDEPERAAEVLTVPPGSEWLVDYGRAEEVGMAVTVTLEGGNATVDRVVALGTRASLSPTAGADELEDLLRGHRFSDGLALLPQGAPTNNTDAERSPFRSRREPVPPSLVEPVATPGSDATATAAVLGIDPARFTGLVGDGTGEQQIARHVNTALWAPGWGEYLNRLDEQGVPGVVDAQRESARGLFRDHVRGRGPASAIHVGAQPYGVLPVSDLGKWAPRTGETTEGIVKVVRRLLDRWLVAADRRVPKIRPGGGNVTATTLEVLGSSPVLQGLRVRPVVSDDVSTTLLEALGIDHREYEAEKISMSAVAASLLLEAAPRIVIGSLHDETRPLPLPLASRRDPEFIQTLLESPSQVLAVDSVLQALLVLAWQSSELDVAKASPASVLPALVELVELDPILKARTAAVVARADAASSAELHGVVTELQQAGVAVGGLSTLREYQPVEHIQTSLAEVALSAPPTPQARILGASALAGWLLAMGYRGEVREAMQQLVDTTVGARRLAVAEALDCSSHRLDAWATAVVSERRTREVDRKGGPAQARGLTIGAYGVVEDLRPAPGAGLDGWIHAPTTRHAVAAGMLRSAHISHLPTAGTEGGPFAIDLSSRRMQSAAHVIEGVRQGQQLGALVGYQIERGLAEANLARLQLSLRTIAPLVARRLSDADGGDTQTSREAVAATNVVDGALLLTRHEPGDAALRAALDVPPANAYLDPGDWEPLTDPEWDSVTEIMRRAADTIDAVADVMLSESVLQFANGNPQRAAAAMDAMSTGASPSDTIDVLETFDAGERLNHRVLAIVGADAASGWNASRPRALLEPRLEAWAAAHLGDPADIVVAETDNGRISLADSGLAALDLVFATDPVSLEAALRVALPDLEDAELAMRPEPGWPTEARTLLQVLRLAATLRGLLAGAHPLIPADLARPGEPGARSLEAALSELTGRVATLAGSLAAAVAALESTVAGIPADGILEDEDEATVLGAAAYALDAFGVPLQPNTARPLDVSWVQQAWHTAEARSIAAQTAVTRIGELPAGTPPHLVLDAAQEAVATVFGDGFVVVPLLAPSGGVDPFVDAIERPAFDRPTASELRRLLRDLSTVRTQLTRLSEVLTLGSAFGRPRTPQVVQLTERHENGDPAPGTTRWLAGPLPPEGPWPAGPVAHLVVDAVGTIDAAASLAGVVVDAWVEDLPGQVGPKADPDDPRPERARTGLAIRSNSASARAPQAVLCAVSPDGRRWTTDALRGVVEQTLDLARVRMVTLERLAGEAVVLPALYTRSSSLQGEQHLIFQKLAELGAVSIQMPFVKEVK